MNDNSDLLPNLVHEDAFEMQMRGYSRRQVDEFIALVDDLAFHDRLAAGRGGRADPAGGRAAAVTAGLAAFGDGRHRASPSSIGTPTSEPYSVHEPS